MILRQEAEPLAGQPEVGICRKDIAHWGRSAAVDGYCREIWRSLSIWVEAPALWC